MGRLQHRRNRLDVGLFITHGPAQAQADPDHLERGGDTMRHFPPLDKHVSPARLARRVDSLCDRFEAAWKKGRRPKLECYLAHVPPAAQPELLRELLMLELEYRPQTGQKPEVEEYHGRFPEHRELIDTVFREAIPE